MTTHPTISAHPILVVNKTTHEFFRYSSDLLGSISSCPEYKALFKRDPGIDPEQQTEPRWNKNDKIIIINPQKSPEFLQLAKDVYLEFTLGTYEINENLYAKAELYERRRRIAFNQYH